MARLLSEVRGFRLARPGLGVVGVSGGADSVALLRALRACGGPLTVAHINHQLRGAESDADAAFVRELCAALGVECRVRSADVAALAAGGNLEAAARQVRYAFFAEVAAERGADWVATAHTADDQAETVLHRIIRGTGIQGLRGIAAEREDGRTTAEPRSGLGLCRGPTPPSPPSLQGRGEKEALYAAEQADSTGSDSPLPAGRGVGGVGPRLVPDERLELGVPDSPLSFSRGGARSGDGAGVLLRPLLRVTRAEVLAYLSDLAQPFRVDSSNADANFTRNRIRLELLPLLKSFNPDVVRALCRLADHADEAHEIVTAAAADLLAKAELPRAPNAVIFDVAALGRSAALVRAVLRLIWAREGWPQSDMTAESWDRAVEVACGGRPACDFPGGVSARRVGRVVHLSRASV